MLTPTVVPKTAIFASRIGMVNKYAYDYACEDEFFEKEMTLLDGRLLQIPMEDNFRHVSPPVDEIQPPHWNDVRFNFIPQNLDRRCFIHDTVPRYYNFEHDYLHG